MARKRPCRICRRWFRPHPRAGDRQRTCSARACQAERRRRAVAAWRRRHPAYDAEDRLRRRLQREEEAGGGVQRRADPLRAIDWRAARNAVGMEVAVVLEETGRVLVRWARNPVPVQGSEIASEFAQVPGGAARNGIVTARASP